jgi:pimeloyl-ACP methyl ester carboxylesterase
VSAPVTSRNEVPVVFDAGDEQLFGMFTVPPDHAKRCAVVTLWGAGGFPSFGRNQIRMRFARELAARGFHSLRVDYRGIGESGGQPREPDLHELWTDDALGAARWLEERGLRIVIVGVCFGARTALAAGPDLPGLTGLVLVAPPLGEAGHREAILEQPLTWYLRRALTRGGLRRIVGRGGAATRRRHAVKAKIRRIGQPRTSGKGPSPSEASPQFLTQIEWAVRARIPLLILFGTSDDFFAQFERACNGPLGRLLEEAGPRASVHTSEHHMGGLASVEAQTEFLTIVTDWIESLGLDADMTTPKGDIGLRLD